MLNKKIIEILHEINRNNPPSTLENIAIALSKAIDSDYLIVSQINHQNTHLIPNITIHKQQTIDIAPFSLIDSPCAEALVLNDAFLCDDIKNRYPNNLILKKLNTHSYVGFPITTSEGKNAIIMALYSNPVKDSKMIINLISLFSGIIKNELKYQEHHELVAIPSGIISKSATPQLVFNEDRIIIYVNDAMCQLIGQSRLELIGQHIQTFYAESEKEGYFNSIVNVIADKLKWSGRFNIKTKDNCSLTKWVKIKTIVDSKNTSKRYILQVHEVDSLRDNNLKLFKQATIDELTKLPNKHLLLENINLKLTQTNVDNHCFNSALVLFDIDAFRNINTTFGRTTGDALLVAVAQQIQLINKESYTFSRITNDSFAIFIPHINSITQINNFAEKIIKIFEEPFIIEHFSIHCNISMGISLSSQNDENAFRLLNKAEQAKAISKSKPYNDYFYFNQTIENNYIRHLTLKEELHDAIKNDKIEVFFQPIVCMKENAVRKFEALVRWHHKNEWISPVEFIPIAEKHGLIKQVGEIVLRKSCQHLQYLKQHGYNDISFTINRSVHEIPSKKSEKDNWLNIIYQYGLTPSDICFELTESTLASEIKGNFLFLDGLRDNGCKIALDDFGTGYSSLSYLRKLNIDLLKIDRSFVSEMVENKADRNLVKAILAIATSLDINVVAEGAETEEQVRLLEKLGCDFIQGYYFSKPIPMNEVLTYLEESKHIIIPTKKVAYS